MATLYLVETLKSINDTALSDWRGVIGDELQRQEVLKRIADVSKELAGLRNRLLVSKDVEPLENHIRQIEDQLGKMTWQSAVSSGSTTCFKGTNADLDLCPRCDSPIATKIRPGEGATRVVECISCDAHVFIRNMGHGHVIVKELEPYSYSLECPVCKQPLNGTIIDVPGSMKSVTCERCEARITVSRSRRALTRRSALERLYRIACWSVASLLPPETWEKGIHLQVASNLGSSRKMTTRIIEHLIERGMFLPQRDGKIMAPAQPMDSDPHAIKAGDVALKEESD